MHALESAFLGAQTSDTGELGVERGVGLKSEEAADLEQGRTAVLKGCVCMLRWVARDDQSKMGIEAVSCGLHMHDAHVVGEPRRVLLSLSFMSSQLPCAPPPHCRTDSFQTRAVFKTWNDVHGKRDVVRLCFCVAAKLLVLSVHGIVHSNRPTGFVALRQSHKLLVRPSLARRCCQNAVLATVLLPSTCTQRIRPLFSLCVPLHSQQTVAH